jgi:hypothetical protein
MELTELMLTEIDAEIAKLKMELTELMLTEIDAEIARLKQVRTLLAGDTGTKRGPGRPKAVVTLERPVKKKKHKLTPEGRARIAAAVKKRWERQKKAGN